jgi:hypothetical protein
MAGWEAERRGVLYPIPGAAQTPVRTITDADLAVGHQLRWSPIQDRQQAANAGDARYLEPKDRWQPMPCKSFRRTDWETDDGEQLPTDFDLTMMSSKTQAERVLEIFMREQRASGSGLLTVDSHVADVEAGDWIAWQSAFIPGGTITVLVRRIEESEENRTRQFYIEETGTSIYGGGTFTLDPYVPPDEDPEASYTNLPAAFAIANTYLTRPNGRRIPKLLATWTPITDPYVTSIRIRVRRVGDTQWSYFVADEPADGQYLIPLELSAEDTYQAQARVRTRPQRPSDWTPSTPTTATAGTPRTRAEELTGTFDDRVLPLRHRIRSMNGFRFDTEWNGTAFAANTVAWDAGTIRYVDANGVAQSATVAAGNFNLTSPTAANPIYLVWAEGGTALLRHTNHDTAVAAGALIAVYRGGDDIAVKELARAAQDGAPVSPYPDRGSEVFDVRKLGIVEHVQNSLRERGGSNRGSDGRGRIRGVEFRQDRTRLASSGRNGPG